MRRVLVLALLCSACGGSAPSAPTSTPPVTPPVVVTPTPAATFSGTLSATNGGQPLAGITLSIGGTTDGSGRFTVPANTAAVTFSGPSILTRVVNLQAPGHAFAADAITLSGGFDLAFYREFARNGFESPGALDVLRPRASISLYLKTVDEAGQPVDGATLDAAQGALIDSVQGWTGGRFGFTTFTRGTASMEGQPGWTTVKWLNPPEIGRCGETSVGADGGTIALNYLGANCSCGGQSRIYPRVVRHELGHALGYWHTDSPSDAMYGQALTLTTQCVAGLSQREMIHAAVMYKRARGNVDPDVDPSGVNPLRLRDAPRVID